MNVHEQVLSSMHDMAENFSRVGVKLQMPPPSNATLGTRYTDIDFGRMLAAEVKFDPKFSNPMHVFQGGFLCAIFDEVYGPLTYMATGRPVVTIEMSTTFLRPFTERDEFVIVRAEVVAQSKTLLVLKAEARNKKSKLIATSTSHSLIATDHALKRKPQDSPSITVSEPQCPQARALAKNSEQNDN
jgi:uncharacterized protein (TIGR00369 family)